MPKRASKPRLPDPNLTAIAIVEAVTGETLVAKHAPLPLPTAITAGPGKNPAAVILGHLGGIKGGLARAKKLSKKERSDIARKAALARWEPQMAKKPKKSPGKKPPPVCKAILLCDAVLHDPFLGKASVIGIFERFFLPSFPGMTTRFFAFVQLTSGIGRYAISVELRDTQSDTTIARGDLAEVFFPDRATKINLILPVPNLPLPRAGEYDFIVFADEQEIDRQQFIATIPEPPNATDNPESAEGSE